MSGTAADGALRVVYLWDADYPWDVRTEKLCRAMTDAGHDVHVVARNRAWSPRTERLAEATVHRMRPWRWAGRRLDGVLGFPAFFSPRWLALLAGVVRRVRPHVLIARDLPLCPTALAVGRAAGVPVVLDMAEDYPARLRDVWRAGVRRPGDVLVRNPAAAAAVERFCLPRVDRVLVVVRESGERLRAMGVPAERIAVVSNTPPAARARVPVHRPLRSADDPLRLVYLGLMEIPRGIGDLLRAMRLLADRGVDARLRLIGAGRDLPRFRALADELGLEAPRVVFEGYVPNAEALRRVARAEVGIVPHHATDGWSTTIPNKLFDFMAAGLPVVSSDPPPAARIVRETGAGLVFRAGDAASLADAVAAMRDPSRRAAMGAAGRRAVLSTWNAEADAAVLLRTLASVAAERAARPAALPRATPRRA